jgi:photosystem II stability/assembly factor-like uncharacterized protein
VTVLILVGTCKGLFQLEGDEGRRSWTLREPTLTGWEVFHAVRDPRDGNIHAATNSWAYGPTTHRSTDRGTSWERAADIGLPESSGLTLERTWHVEPGPAAEPDVLYLGGTPGALLRSSDGGASWEAVRGVVEHPTRDRWQPGAGGMCCHSIQLEPNGSGRMYIAISAGAFRSEDAGETWKPINKNVAADFMPDPYRSSASASTSRSSTPSGRSGSGNRITAASTAPTTAAKTGSVWTATASPTRSASASPSIRATPTPPT